MTDRITVLTPGSGYRVEIDPETLEAFLAVGFSRAASEPDSAESAESAESADSTDKPSPRRRTAR